MKRVLIILILLGIVCSSPARAEVNFQEQIKKLASNNAEMYIGPFATAFGTAMNSGLYHTAKPHKLFGFDISIKTALVQVSEEDLVFDFMLGGISIDAASVLNLSGDSLWIDLNDIYSNRETPTVFGADEIGTLEPDVNGPQLALTNALLNAGKSQAEINDFMLTQAWDTMLDFVSAYAQPIPTVQGIGIDMLPLVMPQVSVGLPFKTEVLLRYLPTIDAGVVGEVNFLTIGVKHSLSQYIPLPMFPLDISGQYVIQKLEIGDILESTHTAMNIEVSKKLGIGISITPYVGAGIESSDLSVDYTVDNPGTIMDGENVSFELEGKNDFRMTGGIRLGLAFLTINADYSTGEYNTASLGIGLTLR